MPANPEILAVQPLTREAFASFGDVIETEGAAHYPINNGTTERYHDLAAVETAGEGGRPLVSILRGQPFALPLEIRMVERHPLGSQAFFPLHRLPWIVVVAPDSGGRPGRPIAFKVEPGQGGLRGVNYRRNVWHHPLISLEKSSDFLVIDRGGGGRNLEEYSYREPWLVTAG